MKTAVAVLLLAFAATTTCNRHLLASVPAPAPGPSACPPKQSASSGCIVAAATFQAGCSDYISALNKATGGKVVAETDAQIKALISQLGAPPSATCCAAATSWLSNACVCDSTVQALAMSAQNLSPKQLQTVGAVFLTACGKPTCTDTCQLSS